CPCRCRSVPARFEPARSCTRKTIAPQVFSSSLPPCQVLEVPPRFQNKLMHTGPLRARRERPRRRAAEQRYEVAPFHCPMPPVLPTERIAPLGTVDCCTCPPGRYETIAVTPPIIFSKEVAQKQATPLTAPGPPHRQKSFLTKFPGMVVIALTPRLC